MRSSSLVFALLAIVCLPSALLSHQRYQRSVMCNKRLPMTDYFEHGYDLSEYDIFGCPEFGGKRAKFANLNTCDKGAKFKLSGEVKTEYDLPDQFLTANQISSSFSATGKTYTDMSNLRYDIISYTLSQKFRTRIGNIDKAFFVNSQFYKEIEPLLANKSIIAITDSKYAIYEVGIQGGLYNKAYFTPDFVNDINSLPEKFVGNENTYLDFIKKYGTHVITDARFGAAVYRFTAIRPQDLIHRKEYDINWEMRKDAMALNDSLNILCEKKEGHRQVLKVHAKNRDFIQVMVGGIANTRLYANRSLPVKEIHASPALISSEVIPISILFDNKEKEKNVQEAIKVYIAKAYIRSKVASIQVLLNSGRVPRKETTEALAKAERSANVYNEDELAKVEIYLIREISELGRY